MICNLLAIPVRFRKPLVEDECDFMGCKLLVLRGTHFPVAHMFIEIVKYNVGS